MGLTQKKAYTDELKILTKSEVISDKSSLNNLNPFIDSSQVLRVNGRLTWKISSLSLALHVTGFEFAGPFELKSSMLRRAIHSEPCSELSSVAFEAALVCFVGSRGLPHRVVSDNGRNFIGTRTSNDISTLYPTTRLTWKVSGSPLQKCLNVISKELQDRTDLHSNNSPPYLHE